MSGRISIAITIAGQKMHVPVGTSLEDLKDRYQPQHKAKIVAAVVNGKLKELTFTLQDDAHIEFLDLSSDDGQRIYVRSLSFLLIRAAQDLFPGGKIRIQHSLGNGLYIEFHGPRPLLSRDIPALKRHMREMVKADFPFVKSRVPLPKAREILRRQGQEDKVELLKYREKDYINMYELEGLYDYFFGYMVPSTGYLDKFALHYYLPGLILLFPNCYEPEKVPPYKDQPKLARIFSEAEGWGDILRIGDVASLNRHMAAGQGPELIQIAEALHEKKIAQIADEVTERHDDVRVVFIAGPSSSGKTTFTQRLYIQLRVNGLRPVTISLDDYFVNREDTPLNEEGEYDFESLEALDLELFNHHLVELIQGMEVEVPVYDFNRGRRIWVGRRLQVEPGQPILVEGIHGLNPALAPDVPEEKRFCIYISALTQLSIDRHNRIPTTDTRLLRRIIRDYKYRSASPEDTILRWASVRHGEECNIFPYQEEADVMFNSALVYELAAMKEEAEALLATIPPLSPAHLRAKMLRRFLGYFHPLAEREYIPRNSILREFIGD